MMLHECFPMTNSCEAALKQSGLSNGNTELMKQQQSLYGLFPACEPVTVKNEYSNPPLSSVYPTVTVPLISTLHLLQTNASSLFIFPFSYPPNFTSFDVLFGLPWVWHLRSQAQIHTFLNPIIASCHPFVMHHHTVITFYVAIQRQYPVALTSLSFQHNLWNS